MIGREVRRELNERKIRGFTRGSKQLFFDALEECVIRETVFEKLYSFFFFNVFD